MVPPFSGSPARRLSLLFVIPILALLAAVSSTASAQEPAPAADRTDWTRRIRQDAAFVLRADSLTRLLEDTEQLLSAVNPMASMMTGAMLAQIETQPLYLAVDRHRPLAISAVDPDRHERGGVFLVVPLDDPGSFRDAIAEQELPVHLHEFEGYALVALDEAVTPERVFAQTEHAFTTSRSTLTGTLRMDELSRLLRRTVDSVAEEMPGAAPEGMLPVVARLQPLLGALSAEVTRVVAHVDLGRKGVFVRAGATPAEGSELAKIAAAHEPAAHALRGVGRTAEAMRASGRLDFGALASRLRPYLVGFCRARGLDEERADSTATQVEELAGLLAGEFGVSVGYDPAKGFLGTQAFRVKDAQKVEALLRGFASDPTWLEIVYSAGDGVRFETAPPGEMGEVPVTDYRVIPAAEPAAGGSPGDPAAPSVLEVPGILVATPPGHLVLTLGEDRAARMTRELERLGTPAPAEPRLEGVPRESSLDVSVSLLDYVRIAMARQDPALADALGDGPPGGSARVGWWLAFSGPGLEAGLSLPASSIREATDYAQNLVVAQMRRAAQPPGPAAEPEAAEGSLESYVGREAPDFTLPAAGGGRFSLSDHRGAVVLLDFFGTWCPPCVELVPAYVELQRRYADRGLVLVGVSDEDADTIRGFAKEHDVPYPLLTSFGAELPEPYTKILTYPTTLLIGRDGKIAHVQVGPALEGAYADRIRKLLDPGEE